MKTNVDLTASRTFSTQRREISLTNVMREFGKHFLWDYEHMKMVHSDYDLSNYRDSLILCGNASERQAQRFNHALDTGDICECCGARLTEKPWKKHYCLCSRCAEELDYNCQRTWRYKEDRLWQSDDFLIREMNRRM